MERSNRAALISTPDRIRHSLAKFGLEAPAYFNQFNKLNKLADSVGAVNLTSAMVDIEVSITTSQYVINMTVE